MGKTKRLSLEEKAEYLELCCAYWVGGCVMGLDDMKEHTDLVDLFVRRGLVDDDGITWLNIQLAEASTKSDQAKRAASIRWGKREESERNADAMRPHTDRNADAYQTQCVRNAEEREEIEREEREIEREAQQVADAPLFDSEGNEVEQPTNQQAEDQKEKVAPKRKRFEPPTEQEVEVFFQTTDSPASWTAFYNYYLANGWKVGRNPMKDWKAAARNWVAREKQYNNKPQHNGKRQPVTEELMRDIANDIANGGWNFAEGA